MLLLAKIDVHARSNVLQASSYQLITALMRTKAKKLVFSYVNVICWTEMLPNP